MQITSSIAIMAKKFINLSKSFNQISENKTHSVTQNNWLQAVMLIASSLGTNADIYAIIVIIRQSLKFLKDQLLVERSADTQLAQQKERKSQQDESLTWVDTRHHRITHLRVHIQRTRHFVLRQKVVEVKNSGAAF